MSRVARFHADRTNQKLYFARLSCQQAEQVDHIQQAQAHREVKWYFIYMVHCLLFSKSWCVTIDSMTLHRL